MKTTTQYETGATSHAINDLILFTDNTRELAEIRDRIYSNAYNDGLDSKTLALTFEQLFNSASMQYCKEFPHSCSHITSLGLKCMFEFTKLYADDFNNWISEHEMYELTHNGKVIYKGLENNCYYKLQSYQSHSADWAIKYEGYKVTKTKDKTRCI